MNVSPRPGRLHGRVPVLLLGGGVTPLGAGRSLGPLGIPVYSTSDRRDVVARSRWVKVLDGGLADFSSVDQLAGYLGRSRFERLVLMPCSDAWSETVSALPASLSERFPSFIPEPAVL